MASHTYLRRKARQREEQQKRYSRAGVQARERKKQSESMTAECVGTITFDGPLFGGHHVMRCLYADWYDERHLMIEIDGTAFRPLTRRGIERVIARRIV